MDAMKKHVARATLAAAIAVVAGCNSAPDPNKKIALQIEPQPSLVPLAEVHRQEALKAQKNASIAEEAEPQVERQQAEVVSALAKKTESYAKAIETSVAKRAETKQAAVTTAAPKGEAPTTPAPATPAPATSSPANPAPKESLVQWLDPSEFRIGPPEPQKDSSAAKSASPFSTTPIAPTTPVAAAPQKIEQKPPVQTTLTLANQEAAVAAPAQPAPADTANSPITIAPDSKAETASSVTMTAGADAFELRIAKRAREYPRDVSANLDNQLLMFLRDESVPQLNSLSGLPTEDRELISAVMDGLSNFRNTLRQDNNMLLSRKIRPLTDLADRLSTQADLSIPTLTLCTKVEGFGRYDAIEPAHFVAQKEQQAIVYLELENFSSKQNDAKMWQTDVTQEAVLYTEDGLQVWADKTQRIQDLCRNRRHDFFLRTLVKFPGNLTVGRYMLKVTIVDQQANHVAEASLPIQMVAQ
jgi:hypothetical protein